jgi:hypothetical protein
VAFGKLWSDDGFGVSFEAIPECARPTERPSTAYKNTFPCGQGRGTPKEIAMAAVNPATSTADRARVATILSRLTRYLSAEFALPRLFTALQAQESTARDLQAVFDWWRSHDGQPPAGASARAAGGAGAATATAADVVPPGPPSVAPVRARSRLEEEEAAGALHAVRVALPAGVAGGEAADVRYWLWDLDAEPPTFDVARAVALFTHVGVCGGYDV